MKYLTISKWYGRHGNQLWTVAALFGLAKKHGYHPLIPTDWWYRNYCSIPNEYYGNIKTDIVIKETQYHYDPFFLSGCDADNVGIIGGFQSILYFEGMEDQLKKWLRPNMAEDLGLYSVGIHLRRGDYVGNPGYVQYPPEWYRGAINKYFSDSKYHFYLSSDDSEFARKEFPAYALPPNQSPITDFTILASCHNHIMSGSSFSFWSAFLAPEGGINIRVPRTHTGHLSHLDESHSYLPTWKIHNNMNIILISYADDKYLDKQIRLVKQAEKLEQFDHILHYNTTHLKNTKFYKENKKLLSEEKGGGYWRWKPYYILETLKQMSEGDVLMYLDSGDMVFSQIRQLIEKEMQYNDVLLTAGSNVQAEWTKMDCFVGMGCASNKYFEALQVEAGCIVVKKTDFSVKFITEWLSYCMTSIVDDTTSKAPNVPGFKEHRHDQSVLTNLGVKYNIKKSEDIRRFVECNYESFGMDTGRADLSDVTFIIPIRYDSKERKENLDVVLAFLNKYFVTNIIVGEQGSEGTFSYVAGENVTYVDFDKYPGFYNPLFVGAFHRTRMLNLMTMMANTEIIFNWDCDVLVDPHQLVLTVQRLRNGVNFCYPYAGAFLHVRRGYFDKIRETLDVSWMRNIEFPGLNDNSVGGAVGFRKSAYFKIGLEDENFISHAPEDVNRFHRFRTIGGGFERELGPLFHMEHPMLENSSHNNEWVIFNNTEWRRTKSLKTDGWKEYIKGWKWIDEYKQRFNYSV